MWCTPPILALRRQREKYLSELESSLSYRVSARTTQTDPDSKTTSQTKNRKGEKRILILSKTSKEKLYTSG